MTLESGKEYSLSQLFSGNNKIVIPDLQRDYCWGDKAWDKDKENYTELVSGFINNLKEAFNDKPNDILTLGLIYGYESPKCHIQLSDGQQRITTLFLLLGMLNKKTEDNKFKKYLIFDYESNELNEDDKEPYLQYAIRESTLYFLGDLVTKFFNKKIKSVDDIYQQDWYFKEYDLDASIQSMISALKTIDKLLKETDNNFSYKKFGDFVLEKIKMIYYDMGNRTRGEETFVIINTTGEPLTATENLKPILIGNIESKDKRETASNEWEEREEWFWQNRNKEKDESTSDNGMNDFFIWYVKIQEKKENVNIHKYFLDKKKKNKIETELDKLNNYFVGLKKVIELLENNSIQKQFKFINTDSEVKGIIGLRNLTKERQQANILLPLLYFVVKYTEKDIIQFLRRLRKNYFDLIWEDRKDNYLDWRYILQIIDKSSDAKEVLVFDTDHLDNIQNIEIKKWYNEEEKLKDELRKEDKQKIEEWEDHEDFMGDLKPLFNVTSDTKEISTLERFFNTYIKIRIRDYRFSDNVFIQNIYRLYSYLEHGRFEHRSVGGYGYCMLIEYDGKDFLKSNFSEIWEKFNQNNEDIIINFFKDKLINYFQDNIFRSEKLDEKLDDFNSFGQYEKVRLWAVLEFLFNDNEKNKLDFSNSISCFWENKQNLKNKDNENFDYQIGNLLLGTSYFNNKTGWVLYDEYPLMKSIKDNDTLNVSEQTNKYKDAIRKFLKS